jgi:hypothetical protein
MPDESYLGDGLYASFDGYMITLRAPRENGDDWVGIEPPVLMQLLMYVDRHCKGSVAYGCLHGFAANLLVKGQENVDE